MFACTDPCACCVPQGTRQLRQCQSSAPRVHLALLSGQTNSESHTASCSLALCVTVGVPGCVWTPSQAQAVTVSVKLYVTSPAVHESNIGRGLWIACRQGVMMHCSVPARQLHRPADQILPRPGTTQLEHLQQTFVEFEPVNTATWPFK